MGPHFAEGYDPQGRVILSGRKVDGMYRIECSLPTAIAARVNCSAASSASLWHCRSGHVGQGSLKKTIRTGSVLEHDQSNSIADTAPVLPGSGFILPEQSLVPKYHPGDSHVMGTDTDSTTEISSDEDADAVGHREVTGTGGAANGTGDMGHDEEASVAGYNAKGHTNMVETPCAAVEVAFVPEVYPLDLEDTAESVDTAELFYAATHFHSFEGLTLPSFKEDPP